MSVEQLAPELREILRAELARGNTIREISDWPPQCSLFVSLARQFGQPYSVSVSVVYAEVNDPHYWKYEYRLSDNSQVLVCGFDE